MILQVEATGLFSDVAQLGIVFTLLVAIIVVLGRRVVKLEKVIEGMHLENKTEAKEQILIIKGASEAMKKVAKYIEDETN